MFRADPILATLNRDDLNQRFRSSVIYYCNSFRFCTGFQHSLNNGYDILLGAGNGITVERFDPAKLLVGRFPPQWVSVAERDGTLVPAYFFYLPRRQYQRGWSNNNCAFVSVRGGSYDVTPGNIERLQFKSPKAIPLKLKELLKEVGNQGFKILNHDICVAIAYLRDSNRRKPVFFYRNTRVATVDSKKNLLMINKCFEPEIREVVVE